MRSTPLYAAPAGRQARSSAEKIREENANAVLSRERPTRRHAITLKINEILMDNEQKGADTLKHKYRMVWSGPCCDESKQEGLR